MVEQLKVTNTPSMLCSPEAGGLLPCYSLTLLPAAPTFIFVFTLLLMETWLLVEQLLFSHTKRRLAAFPHILSSSSPSVIIITIIIILTISHHQ